MTQKSGKGVIASAVEKLLKDLQQMRERMSSDRDAGRIICRQSKLLKI